MWRAAVEMTTSFRYFTFCGPGRLLCAEDWSCELNVKKEPANDNHWGRTPLGGIHSLYSSHDQYGQSDKRWSWRTIPGKGCTFQDNGYVKTIKSLLDVSTWCRSHFKSHMSFKCVHPHIIYVKINRHSVAQGNIQNP